MKESLTAYPSRGGKCLRPALLLWCCGLFDKRIEKSVKVAAAVELYHIWTLVHDDIIDNDNTRRGAPAVHISIKEQCENDHNLSKGIADKFGKDLGILCGDIQQAWANNLILQATDDGVPAETVFRILRRLNEHVNPHLISGEALDVTYTFLPITDISPEEMTNMLILKTGVLIRFAAECGALIGLSAPNFDDQTVSKIGDFAEKAALAFQLKDDLLGMFADETELGKPVGSDLREGKRTLLFSIAGRRFHGKDLDYFFDKLGRPNLQPKEIEKVCKMIVDCGAKETIEQRIRDLLADARDDLQRFPTNDFRTLLTEWVNFVDQRTF